MKMPFQTVLSGVSQPWGVSLPSHAVVGCAQEQLCRPGAALSEQESTAPEWGWEQCASGVWVSLVLVEWDRW